ncbi:MAG: hypothetical protein AAGB12_03705 [Pseudomonadota bacterium]
MAFLSGFTWPLEFLILFYFLVYSALFSFVTVNIRYNNLSRIWSAEDVPVSEYGVVFICMCLGGAIALAPMFVIEYSIDTFANIIHLQNGVINGEQSNIADISINLSLILITFYLSVLYFGAIMLAAASCHQVSEIFKPRTWTRALFSRSGDYILICSLLMGVVVTQLILIVAPTLLLYSLVNQHTQIPADLTTYIALLPTFLTAIPMAKWSGIFAQDTDTFLTPKPIRDMRETTDFNPTKTLDGRKEPRIVTAIQKLNLVRHMKEREQKRNTAKKHSLPSDDNQVDASSLSPEQPSVSRQEKLAQLIKQLRESYSQNPDDLNTLQKLVIACKEDNRREDMIAYANTGIARAMNMAEHPLALKMYFALGKDKQFLKLDALEWQEFAHLLEKEQRYVDAWLCYLKILKDDAADQETTESKLLDLAKRANNESQPKQAIQLYEHFLKKFPNSEVHDVVKTSLSGLKLRH